MEEEEGKDLVIKLYHRVELVIKLRSAVRLARRRSAATLAQTKTSFIKADGVRSHSHSHPAVFLFVFVS